MQTSPSLSCDLLLRFITTPHLPFLIFALYIAFLNFLATPLRFVSHPGYTYVERGSLPRKVRDISRGKQKVQKSPNDSASILEFRGFGESFGEYFPFRSCPPFVCCEGRGPRIGFSCQWGKNKEMQLGWKFFSGKLSSSRQIRARQITGQKLQPLQNTRAPHKEIAEALITIMQRADIGEKDKTLFPSRNLFPSSPNFPPSPSSAERPLLWVPILYCILLRHFYSFLLPPFGKRGGKPVSEAGDFFLGKKKRGGPSITPFLFPASALSPILLICRAKKKSEEARTGLFDAGKQTGVSPLHDFCPKESKKRRTSDERSSKIILPLKSPGARFWRKKKRGERVSPSFSRKSDGGGLSCFRKRRRRGGGGGGKGTRAKPTQTWPQHRWTRHSF